MIGNAIAPADVGPLHHHGPELFPVFDLIAAGVLPVTAAIWLGRLRSVGARLTGGAAGAVEPALAERNAGESPAGDPIVRSAGAAPVARPSGEAGNTNLTLDSRSASTVADRACPRRA